MLLLHFLLHTLFIGSMKEYLILLQIPIIFRFYFPFENIRIRISGIYILQIIHKLIQSIGNLNLLLKYLGLHCIVFNHPKNLIFNFK